MLNRVSQNPYKLGNIVGLPKTHTDTPRLPSHVTFVQFNLLFPLQRCERGGMYRGLVSLAFNCIYRNRELDSAQSEQIYGRVARTARSLYRCSLSCKDAFPSPSMKEELEKAVWNDACARGGRIPIGPMPLIRSIYGIYSPQTERLVPFATYGTNSLSLSAA